MNLGGSMKLVYDKDLSVVKVGDRGIAKDGKHYDIVRIVPPESARQTGRVYLKEVGGEEFEMGYYPNVIDATWIEREDRPLEKIHVCQDGKDFYIDEDQKNFFTPNEKLLSKYKNGFAHYQTEEWIDDMEHATAARTWFTTFYCVLNGYEPIFT